MYIDDTLIKKKIPHKWFSRYLLNSWKPGVQNGRATGWKGPGSFLFLLCPWIAAWRWGTRRDMPTLKSEKQNKTHFLHVMLLRLWGPAHPANRAAISPRLSVFPFLFSFWLKKLSLCLLVTYLSPILAFCLPFSFLSWCLTCLWPAWFLSISRHLLLHLSYSSISLHL